MLQQRNKILFSCFPTLLIIFMTLNLVKGIFFVLINYPTVAANHSDWLFYTIDPRIPNQ